MRAILVVFGLVATAAVIYAVLPSPAPPPVLQGRETAERPAPPPGSPLRFTLRTAPVPAYGSAEPPSAAQAELVEALGLHADGALSQAARELARQYAQHRALLPGEALQFVLDAAGATFWSVRQTVVVTRDPSPAGVAQALGHQMADDGAGWHGGVGQTPLPDDPDYTVVAVLSARPTVALAPVVRAPAEGEPVVLQGSLAAGFDTPQALALDPAGRFVDLPVTARGAAGFAVEFVPTPGRWVVELLADGPHGPTPVTQLTLEVGGALTNTFDGAWPAAAEGDGAAVIRELVAADRAAHGRAPLIDDPTLDAVARGHSRDMKANRFLGHISPTTGRPAQRVRAADYRAAIVAENVAFNRSLTDAQTGLMRSLGHRRNLLNDQVTHFGVAAERGPDGWYVTQVFARPRPIVRDGREAAGQLARQLAAQLDRRIQRSPQLERLARAEARRDDPKPNRVLDAVASEGVRGRVTAWVATLALLEQFEPPEAIHDERFDRVGIGVHQIEREAGPDIQVVMLLAE